MHKSTYANNTRGAKKQTLRNIIWVPLIWAFLCYHQIDLFSLRNEMADMDPVCAAKEETSIP